MLLVLLALVVVVRVFAVGWYPVASDSMAPTIDRGDRVLVDKVLWRLDDPDRGDIVTFDSPEDGASLVKRIVAVAGDRVTIEDGVLVVNREPVVEPYVDQSRIDALYFGPVVVPPDHVFVLGDNRFGSIDSRVFGPVPTSAITGRAVWTWR